jgi:predicted transcriptional regulator
MEDELERAIRLLGPLEGRIMRTVWIGSVPQPFSVREMQARMPELAYTTVMTTLSRLADKELLVVEPLPGCRAYGYRANGGPGGYLAMAGARAAEEVVQRYGEAALAAFVAHLDALTPAQRRRLEQLAKPP